MLSPPPEVRLKQGVFALRKIVRKRRTAELLDKSCGKIPNASRTHAFEENINKSIREYNPTIGGRGRPA
jgi:hypothetical protein